MLQEVLLLRNWGNLKPVAALANVCEPVPFFAFIALFGVSIMG
jgi:hypothetical protein